MEAVKNIGSAAGISEPRVDKSPRVPVSPPPEKSGKSIQDRATYSARESALAEPPKTALAKAMESHVPDDPVASAADLIDQFLADLKGPETDLRIDLDDETGRFVYSAVDRETGEVTRLFPPEVVLERVAAFREVQGMVYDDQV